MNAASRKTAIRQAQAELARRPVYLDTETTGLGRQAEIVEICVLDAEGRPLVNSLVKPQRAIPAALTAIHGISNAMVRTAPTWRELWPRVAEVLAGQRVAIYNADFDLRMLAQDVRRCQLAWPAAPDAFCVMRLYAQFYGEWNPTRRDFRWQSLARAGQQCRIALPNAHRAHADALLTRAVLEYVAARESQQVRLPGF